MEKLSEYDELKIIMTNDGIVKKQHGKINEIVDAINKINMHLLLKEADEFFEKCVAEKEPEIKLWFVPYINIDGCAHYKAIAAKDGDSAVSVANEYTGVFATTAIEVRPVGYRIKLEKIEE